MYEELVEGLRKAAYLAKMQGSNPYRFVAYYIAAADAIEELNLVAESNRRNARTWADTAKNAVEQIPRWIPVTERLPENGSHCLVARYDYVTDTPFVDLLWFDNSWWDRINSGDYSVTHWMPLPEPPKEEK